MHITVVTLGTDSVVIPYIALALGLKRADHEVRFATLDDYKEFINNSGLECIPMSWNFSCCLNTKCKQFLNQQLKKDV